jgi:hypothetical protein
MATVSIWQREPDGRPLYAYKCRDNEYERLKEMVCEQMPQVLSGSRQLYFTAKFCLYAAETFRRHHEGGLGLGRPFLQKLGIQHLIIHVFTNGYHKVWPGGGALC